MKSWITLIVPNEYVYKDLWHILVANAPLMIERELYGAFEDAVNFGIITARYDKKALVYKLVATERGLECRLGGEPPQIWIPID